MSNEQDIIAIDINVSLIDKSALFDGKNGKKLDVVLIPTPDSKYGSSHMAVQGLSSERRQAGEKGAILGNAKILKRHQPAQQTPPAAAQKEEQLPPLADDLKDEEIPF
jgi:hypothetical protein